MKFNVEPSHESIDIVGGEREIDASEVADIFTVDNGVPLKQEDDAPGFLDLGNVEGEGNKPDPEGTIEVDDEGNVIQPKNEDDEGADAVEQAKLEFEKRGDVVEEGEDPKTTSFFSEVAGVLKNKGIFKTLTDVDEDFLSGIKTEDDLAELIANEAKAQMTAETVKLQERLNGTKDDNNLAEFDTAINTINNINIDEFIKDTETSKQLFLEEYTRKGIGEDTANDFFDMYSSKGVLKEKMAEVLLSRKDALENAKTTIINKQQAVIDADKAASDSRLDQLKAKITSGEVFGRKLNSTTVKKMQSLADTAVAKDSKGNPLNALMKAQQDDPIDFEYKMLYLFAATNGLKDMGSFERSAESRVSKDFKNALNGMRDTSVESINTNAKKSKVYTIDPDSIDDIIV